MEKQVVQVYEKKSVADATDNEQSHRQHIIRMTRTSVSRSSIEMNANHYDLNI